MCELNINESEWGKLNKIYSQEELSSYIKEEILNTHIKLPLKNITIDDAKESFINLLNYQCGNIKKDLLTTTYKYSFDNIGNGLCGEYIDESNIGNAASDYFQQYNRFQCDSINSPSPVRTWCNEKFLDGMLKSIWTLKSKCVNSNTFRTCLSLRKYVASQFKPAIAKSVYEKFKSVDVLDFSAGWGDRLCGFYATESTRSYIGIDPNDKVYNNYFEQVELYKQCTGEKKYNIY